MKSQGNCNINIVSNWIFMWVGELRMLRARSFPELLHKTCLNDPDHLGEKWAWTRSEERWNQQLSLGGLWYRSTSDLALSDSAWRIFNILRRATHFCERKSEKKVSLLQTSRTREPHWRKDGNYNGPDIWKWLVSQAIISKHLVLPLTPGF